MHPSLLQAASSQLAPDGQDNDSEETIRRILVDFNYPHGSVRVNSACGKEPHHSNTGQISKTKIQRADLTRDYRWWQRCRRSNEPLVLSTTGMQQQTQCCQHPKLSPLAEVSTPSDPSPPNATAASLHFQALSSHHAKTRPSSREGDEDAGWSQRKGERQEQMGGNIKRQTR